MVQIKKRTFQERNKPKNSFTGVMVLQQSLKFLVSISVAQSLDKLVCHMAYA